MEKTHRKKEVKIQCGIIVIIILSILKDWRTKLLAELSHLMSPEVSQNRLEGSWVEANVPKFATFCPADHQELIPATKGKCTSS